MAVVYGVLGATLRSVTTRLFAYVGIDDSLDVSDFLYPLLVRVLISSAGRSLLHMPLVDSWEAF